MGNCSDCGEWTLIGHFHCRVCGTCVKPSDPADDTGPLDLHKRCQPANEQPASEH